MKSRGPAKRASALSIALALVIGSASGCIVRDRVKVTPLSPSGESVEVTTPVKAHMDDGSTIVYRNGATIGNGVILGPGIRYGLDLTEIEPVESVHLDHVVALESFQDVTDKELTALASTGVTVGVIVGGTVLLKVLFGSCPTVYSTHGEDERLEAELFSHSIAPSLEARDVDRLAATADPKGSVRLEIRNEALETHYLNTIELLEARHSRDEVIVPNVHGEPLALRGFVSPAEAVDRAGRDLLPELVSSDGVAPIAAESLPWQLEDHIDLRFTTPTDQETVALVLHARSSLLGTVLFYDEMLSASGARSLDWLAIDLAQPGPVARLDEWYKKRMGMRISVMEGDDYRTIARIPDAGPIAWKELAVELPAPKDGALRVRLSFVTDLWRVDQVKLATGVRTPSVRPISPSTVLTETSELSVLNALRHADHRYLQTRPGDRLTVLFETGEEPVGEQRSFLLSSQGYYTEWVRGSWVTSAERSGSFEPGDAALLQALGKWREIRETFEKQFHETRLPVSP